MKFSQLILIFVGVFLVIYLFSLPKVVIKASEKPAVIKIDNKLAIDRWNLLTKKQLKHKIHIPQDVKGKLRDLTYSFIKVSNKKKKAKFADTLATLYRLYSKYDSAAKYAQIVSEINPNLGIWERTGDILSEAAEYSSDTEKELYAEKARFYYQQCLDKDPDNTDLKTKLALTYVGGKNTMKGIMQLREIIEKDPKNEKALYSLGVLSLQLGWYDKALNRFQELLKLNPKNELAHFYSGIIYKEVGDNHNAKKHYLEALSVASSQIMEDILKESLKELK